VANRSWSSVRGKVARVTRVNDSGVPQAGPCGTVTTDGFVSVGYSPEISEGEEIEVKKANGAVCVSDKACDSLRWIAISVEFCGVDPAIFSMMTGQPVVTDYKGDLVGIRIGQAINCNGAYGLELWSDVPGSFDSVSGAKHYGYFATPAISNGVIQDFSLENDAATFTIAGTTKPAPGWGRGPYSVDGTGAGNTPRDLLTPFGATDHMDMHLVTIAPPAATGGCAILTLPASYTTDTDTDGTPNTYDTTP
jgi:hypothetical protein